MVPTVLHTHPPGRGSRPASQIDEQRTIIRSHTFRAWVSVKDAEAVEVDEGAANAGEDGDGVARPRNPIVPQARRELEHQVQLAAFFKGTVARDDVGV